MSMYILNCENITVPSERREILFFLRWTQLAEEKLCADFDNAIPFTQKAKRLWYFELLKQLTYITEGACTHIKNQYMIRDNSILSLDIHLATQKERNKAAQRLLEELESTDGEILFQKAPLLKNWIDKRVEGFAQITKELLARLTKDREAVCKTFFDGRDFGDVTRIKTAGADLHFHGRSTCVINTHGGEFVYKPHDCGTDSRFYDIVKLWFSDFLKAPKCLNFTGYGYCEFIKEEAVNSQEAVDRYFQRLGGACALFQALGSNDLHSENWIAHGEYPAVIDMETILSAVPEVFNDPKVYPEMLAEENDFLYDTNRSLIPSSILPNRIKDRQLSVLLDDSQWAHGIPTFNGVKQTVIGHEESFYTGFEQGYDRCIELHRELLDAVKGFEAVPIRRLLRQTSYYALIQKKLFMPSALKSEEGQKEVVRQLEGYFTRHGAEKMKPIAEWEGQCLLEGDIPYFSAKGGGCDLCGYDNVLIPGFFKTSAVENATQRINRLCETEKRFELGILKQSIESAIVNIDKGKAQALISELLPNADIITEEEAVAEAEEIFRKIDGMALCGLSGKTSWVMCTDGDGGLASARPTMAQGTVGMGVFFSGLAAISSNAELKRRARELAFVCLEQVSTSVRLLNKAQVIPESAFSLGITNGFGGVVQSLTLIGRYLDCDTPGQLVLDILPLIDKATIEQAKNTDVFSGAAGLILALCENHAVCSSDAGRKQIRRTADRLLERRRNFEDGGPLLWDTLNLGRAISGAGHGMAGIAAALMAAASVLEDEKYVRAANDALAYERKIYSEELKTWPDLRESSLASRAMHGLCSGAPGVGMALLYCRKMAYKISDSECLKLDEEISKATDVCLSYRPLFRDHLCCGNSSAVEFLLQASQYSDSKGDVSREAAGKLLGRMKKRKDLKNGYSYMSPEYRQVFVPNLFYGGAGIGYEMLRFAAPKLISPILF